MDDLRSKINKIKKINKQNKNTFPDHDAYDALICEAIRHHTRKLNHIIKRSKTNSGTTALSLFFKHRHDSSFDVYCANTG